MTRLYVAWQLLSAPQRTVYHLSEHGGRTGTMCGVPFEAHNVDVFNKKLDLGVALYRVVRFADNSRTRSTCKLCLHLGENLQDPITKLGNLVR